MTQEETHVAHPHHHRPDRRAAGRRRRPAGAVLVEDAWAEFRTAVEAECGKLVEAPADATTAIEVNPFGSESYGAALVTVTLKDGSADRMICVYDKQAKTAELTAPFEAGS